MTVSVPFFSHLMGLETQTYDRLAGAGSRQGVSTAYQVLPDDPIGYCIRSFDGVNAGCEIRVFDINEQEVAGVEMCDANHTLSWPAFSVGSPYNVVIIRIVDVRYKIKEFEYTSEFGTGSLPVQQELDPWFSDPA